MSKNLKDILLGQTLTPTERLYLGSLSMHDGFPVLKKLMEEACRFVNEDVIKTDPEAEKRDYERVLAVRQQRARNINEFCFALLKNMDANILMGQAQSNEEKKDNAGTN
jgi:hypothetical protein